MDIVVVMCPIPNVCLLYTSHLPVIAPDALYLTRDGKHRTFTSFGTLLEEIKERHASTIPDYVQ